MPLDTGDLRPARVLTAPSPEENLRCPRCDSTNTKFCYYNNYNLSQPRHFCKSCRRYWTKGGALRNIPVGGGTRKSAKRTRTTSADNSPPLPLPLARVSDSEIPAAPGPTPDIDFTGSFSSLLASSSAHAAGPGFLTLAEPISSRSGFGLGLAPGLMDEMGFGIGRGMWAPSEPVDAGVNTWQLATGGDNGSLFGEGDCFSWPELAISAQGKGLQ